MVSIRSSAARWMVGAMAAAAVVLASGCATLDSVSSDVSSFGEWPSARALGTYAFERLPSQEARADQQALIESSARLAIERAGFKPAASGATADVLVQVSARATVVDAGWDDRYFWPRVSIYGGRGVFWGVHAPLHRSTRVEREVAVLLRDRASGKTLYETRAANGGGSGMDASLLSAMFDAAMKDFPRPAISPRRVVTSLSGAQPLPSAGPTPAQQQPLR